MLGKIKGLSRYPRKGKVYRLRYKHEDVFIAIEDVTVTYSFIKEDGTREHPTSLTLETFENLYERSYSRTK